MKRWDGEHYVQLRAFQNELYCIEIDFKIYIGGRIWQIKDNTITLIYGKKGVVMVEGKGKGTK